MSHEILFRGKRIDSGEWVYGCHCRFGWTGQERSYIVPSYASACTPIEVDPITVDQYTGLSDKCGVKIFEGDVVRKRWGDVTAEYNVVFDNSLASFIGVRHNSEMFTSFDGDGDLFEVIGNNYDNPEFEEVT